MYSMLSPQFTAPVHINRTAYVSQSVIKRVRGRIAIKHRWLTYRWANRRETSAIFCGRIARIEYPGVAAGCFVFMAKLLTLRKCTLEGMRNGHDIGWQRVEARQTLSRWFIGAGYSEEHKWKYRGVCYFLKVEVFSSNSEGTVTKLRDRITSQVTVSSLQKNLLLTRVKLFRGTICSARVQIFRTLKLLKYLKGSRENTCRDNKRRFFFLLEKNGRFPLLPGTSDFVFKDYEERIIKKVVLKVSWIEGWNNSYSTVNFILFFVLNELLYGYKSILQAFLLS